uniref:Nuclear receptor domain-containing protein n=1 Tax=Rhabditophanes sp. KR3021 TaxID=114890 RepID=A0AC35TPQ3_9BILA
MDKACLVCNEVTNEIHYGISLCNKDKVFFRRSIASEAVYRCSFSVRCLLSQRVKCKKCRLERCLQFINPKDVQMNKTKYEDIKKTNALAIMNNTIRREHDNYKHIFCNLEYLNIKFTEYRKNAFKSPSFYNMAIDEMFLKPSEIGTFEQDSISQCKYVNVDVKDRYFRFQAVDSCLLVLEYAKTWPFFTSLSLNDQKIVIRHSCANIAMLDNSYFSFVNLHDNIILPDGHAPLTIYKPPRPIDIIISTQLIDVIRRIKPTWEEYSILKLLLLCNGNFEISSEGLKVLEKLKVLFSNALLHFNQIRLGTHFGAVRQTELLSVFGATLNSGDVCKKYFLLESIMLKKNGKIMLPLLKLGMDLPDNQTDLNYKHIY